MQGAATIIGVADPYDFRDAVLENVEMIKQRSGDEPVGASDVATRTVGGDDHTKLLTEIRDILARIEARYASN